jgi:hypothetical protein
MRARESVAVMRAREGEAGESETWARELSVRATRVRDKNGNAENS